ncbi:hypothetical protein HC341_06540 [Aquisalimonas sp. 2447]|uniref:hypothetical protein n=1 Tax=Aquisalimonas sp. 2447 TaxID=2740807 RepID=UPI001432588A|nr:hypothetical protein [Aquisalimonas sp. 2447]QIT54903.1 hypothetical protein HC341_06540 [Aquisalimonas sp. 2447]
MVAVARFGLQAEPAQWIFVGDPVMGGQSTGAVEPLDPSCIASLSLFISGKQAGLFALVLYGIDACTRSGT